MKYAHPTRFVSQKAMKPDSHISPVVFSLLADLHSSIDAEGLWKCYAALLQKAFTPVNDILFASPMLGFHPVFARTLSDYPRGEGYWARLVEVAGATDVMTQCPHLPAARMSDHFDRSRERDERLYREFMEPEGWAYCANIFFWTTDGRPLGTLAMNRTAEQGDFSDGEMSLLVLLQPHLQAALSRIIELAHREVSSSALRRSLDRLQFPIVTLNQSLQITFANRAGETALHQWRAGEKGARVWKNEFCFPEDIREVCVQLLQQWQDRIKDDRDLSEALVAEVAHPESADFLVTVRVVNLVHQATEIGFIITFENPASTHHAAARALQRTGALTPGEWDVARLAAVGHHNQDIAVQLGISIHTVRAHLRKIFAKLGIDSRNRLAPLVLHLSETREER